MTPGAGEEEEGEEGLLFFFFFKKLFLEKTNPCALELPPLSRPTLASSLSTRSSQSFPLDSLAAWLLDGLFACFALSA